MRIALTLLLFTHGIAHAVGFALPWRLIEAPGQPIRTTVLGSAIDLGDAGIRAYGVVWLILAVGFALSAVALAMRMEAWYRAVLALVAASTLLCLLSLPATKIGLSVNLLLVIWLLVGREREWFQPA
jgi:hypothetical protein